MEYTIRLERLADVSHHEIGGKALGLVALHNADARVPRSFAVTTTAYREFILHNKLDHALKTLLGSIKSPQDMQTAATTIRDMFVQATVPDVIQDQIATIYEHDDYGPVAVRSSATTEDGTTASHAGQQESYLWLNGIDAVIRHMVLCWASLFNAQALSYRTHHGQQQNDLGMAVVVQDIVDAEVAGVMLTLDPLTGDPSQVTIEACYGFGIGVAQGAFVPDRFSVDKITRKLRSQSIAAKHDAYRFDPTTNTLQRSAVAIEDQMRPCLADAEIRELVTLGARIERTHGCAQDIEWAIGTVPGSHERQLFLLQARPETVWRNRKRPTIGYATKRYFDTITSKLPGATHPSTGDVPEPKQD